MSQTETKVIRKTKTKTLEFSELKTVKWISGIDAVNKTYDFSRQKYDNAKKFPILTGIFATIEMIVISIFLFIHSLPWPNWVMEIIYQIDHLIEIILETISNKVEWLVKQLSSSGKEKGNRAVDLDGKISALGGRMANWRDGLTKETSETFTQLKDILGSAAETLTENSKTQLTKLQAEMSKYFPKNVNLKEYNWIINPFDFNVNEIINNESLKNEIIELQKNSKIREQFGQISLAEFWAQFQNKPALTLEVEKILSYLSEIEISGNVELKVWKQK